MILQVGDKVKWTSQSAGYTKTKCGTVVFVLNPGQPVTAVLLSQLGLRSACNKKSWYGAPRNHETYLVCLPNSKRAYWPRVKHLQKVETL